VTGFVEARSAQQVLLSSVLLFCELGIMMLFVSENVYIACMFECGGALLVRWFSRPLLHASASNPPHHQITKLSHSINAIGPAPHRSGRKREQAILTACTVLLCVKRAQIDAHTPLAMVCFKLYDVLSVALACPPVHAYAGGCGDLGVLPY
jgi:hypothetical protein